MCLFFISTMSYALPFNIVTKSGTALPTSVPKNATVTAYYTVTNNTSSQRNDNFVKSLPAHVTQVVSGGTYGDTCGKTFNLAGKGQSNDSCTLQLTISGPVNAHNPNTPPLLVCFPKGITCAGTNDLLNVTQGPDTFLTSISVTPVNVTADFGSTVQFTAIGHYSTSPDVNLTTTVTWNSNNVLTPIDSSGLATVGGNATITATYQSIISNDAFITGQYPIVSITVTPLSITIPGGTQQFTATATLIDSSTMDVTSLATWNSSNMAVATINSTGLATSVNTGSTNITATFQSITSNTAALTVSNFIYMPPASGPNFNVAPINAAGAVGSFSTTTSNSSANGLAVSSNHYLYYVNAGPSNTTASSCAIGSTGALSNCVTYFSSPNANNGLTSNALYGNFLYLTSPNNNEILRCTLGSNGAFSCSLSNFFTVAGAPQDFKIDPAVNTVGYAATLTAHAITKCDVNPTNGAISNCVIASPNVGNPNYIAIHPSGTFLYIAGSSTGDPILACSIDATTHDLDSCSPASGQPSTTNQQVVGITFNVTGDKVYFTNDFPGFEAVNWCTVSAPSGAMTNCSSASTGGLRSGLAIA